MTPRVTVLLPVHNGMPWLPEALVSIAAQTFRDLEVIVVDDGSTDDSRSTAWRHRVIVVGPSRQEGLAAALNTGWRLAQASLVARLDADDLMRPDRLAKQAAFMDAHPEVGLLGSAWIEKEPDGTVLRLATPPLDDASLRAMLIRRNPFAHSSVMFRTDLVRQVGGYNVRCRVAQDYDLWLRLARVTQMACLPEPLTTRRLVPGRVTASHHQFRRWTEARIRLRAIVRGQYPVSALSYVVRSLVGAALPAHPRVLKPAWRKEMA